MVKKIRGKGIEINFSNKLFYAFIVIGICLAIGAGVYAATVGDAPSAGHLISDIQLCDDDQILKMVSGAWSCEEDGGSTSGNSFPTGLTWGTGGVLTANQGASIELGGAGTPYIDFINADGIDFDMRIILESDNVLKVQAKNAGSGEFKADAFVYTSDRRLKENIQVIPNALDKVMALEGVSFEWIADESNDKNLGFIAQDIESVLPEVVSTGEDGLKAVEYGNIVAVLVEAIKEQQKEIDELKLMLEN